MSGSDGSFSCPSSQGGYLLPRGPKVRRQRGEPLLEDFHVLGQGPDSPAGLLQAHQPVVEPDPDFVDIAHDAAVKVHLLLRRGRRHDPLHSEGDLPNACLPIFVRMLGTEPNKGLLRGLRSSEILEQQSARRASRRMTTSPPGSPRA
jgi:hypothetical protein